MKLIYRLVACFVVFLCNAAILLGQWEWAGGIPASNFETVGSAGKWVIASGRYAGDWPVCSTDGGESWSARSGTGPVAFSPLLVHSATDTFALAVGYGNTVYRLRDTAQTWVRSDSGLGGAQMRWLAFTRAIEPGTNGVAVAVSPTSGVFISKDLGEHWSPSDSGLTTINAMTVTAIDSVLLVGTANQGIFRSVDNGLTWSRASAGLPDTNIIALATISGWTFAASGSNVYRSSDRGEQWTLISKMVPATAQNLVLVATPGRGIGVALFAVTSAGHYRLSAGDSDWVRVKLPPVSISPNDVPFTLTAVESTLYAVDYDQLNCSSDLGNSWFQAGCRISGEIAVGHTSSKSVHPRLYNGPYVSTNFGSKWLSLHQPYDDMSHVAVVSVSPDTTAFGYDRITIGTDSGAVEFSDDAGRTWRVVHDRHWSARGHECFDVAELDGVIFASLQSDKYHHSSSDTVAGVYRTTVEGTTWQKMNTPGLTDTLVLSLDLLRRKDGGRVLFAGTWHDVFRSTNDGESWSTNTLTPVRGGRKHFNQVNGVLFLCTEGFVKTVYDEYGGVTQINDSAGIYKSTDDGLTWKEITGNIKTTFARGFAAVSIPRYPDRILLAACIEGSHLFVGPYGDVLTSTQGGKEWVSFGSGLPRFDVSAPLSADDEFVYCMGRRRPWSEAVLTTVGEERDYRAVAFSLSQNYPNPFNPTTEIRYSVPSGQVSGVSNVKLVVYDMLGREVVALVSEKKTPGSYEVTFDGSRLASGVYVYRLTSGSFSQSRKMVLLK